MTHARPHPLSRPWIRAALAGLALACTLPAQASVVVSTYNARVDGPLDPLYRWGGGHFDNDPGQFLGAGAFSQVYAADTRRSRLPDPVTGKPVFHEVTNASNVIVTTTPGDDVLATAHQGQLPTGFTVNSARAVSAPYQNHARASTSPTLLFRNADPATINGETYPADTFYQEDRRTAIAASGWYETWAATSAGQVDVTLVMDGHMGRNTLCGDPFGCGVASPPGTDSFRSADHWFSLDALFIVFDLDQLSYCPEDLQDECGPSDFGHPTPLAFLKATYAGDEDLALDEQWTLSFDATAGHRYLVMGSLDVAAQDGGVADFFNTMRVTGVDVARGVLREDSSGRDLADVFGSDPGQVPLPATAWLVVVGLGLATVRRRARP